MPIRSIRGTACLLWLFLLAGALAAQTAQPPVVSDLRFGVGMQLLGVYTRGTEADVDGDGVLDPVSDRFDIAFRRARFSMNGRFMEAVDFRVVVFYDNIGRDRYSGMRTLPNENVSGIWDAFVTWRAKPAWANVTLGYFRPQIGRENMTSGFQTNSSMDKLPTQVYQRQHTLGRASGRETGINVGGWRHRGRWGWNYNAGFFDTSHPSVTGTAFGAAKWSPLLLGRFALTYGDPEMQVYGIDYQVNYFGRRNGVTGAVSYARQGENSAFQENETVSFDILANYRNLNFDAEFDVLRRKTLSLTRYQDTVWHVRAGYNIPARGTFVEPVVAVMRFRGDPLSQNNPGGTDNVIDAGVNWYVRQTRVRFNLHYTRQTGQPVSNVNDGRTLKRGGMLGFGVQLVY